jgi:hypothetical protein
VASSILNRFAQRTELIMTFFMYLGGVCYTNKDYTMMFNSWAIRITTLFQLQSLFRAYMNGDGLDIF